MRETPVGCHVLLRDGIGGTDPVPVITLHRVTMEIAGEVARRFGNEIQGKPYIALEMISECDCRGRMVLEGNVSAAVPL